MAKASAKEVQDMQAELEQEMLGEEDVVEIEAPAETAKEPSKQEDEIEFVAEPDESDEGEAAKKETKDDKGDKPEKDDKGADKKKGDVPYDALASERGKRKKAEAAFEELQLKHARLDERLSAINEALQQSRQQQPEQQQQPESNEPNAREDPIGWIEWRQEQDRLQREAWERHNAEQTQQNQTRQQQETEWNNALSVVGPQWQRAMQEDPSLSDAYNAFRDSYARELQSLGWAPHAIQQEMNRAESQYILHAYRNSLPIADMVRSLAQSRGWAPSAPEANEGEPETKEARTQKSEEKLRQLAKAQEASDSLSTISGSGTTQRISLETLDSMSDDEMENLVRQLNSKGSDGMDRALAKMMGIS